MCIGQSVHLRTVLGERDSADGWQHLQYGFRKL
jgi:hypothetical protein